MCNLYRMEKAPDAIAGLARELGRQLRFPEGVPNFQPRDVRITERAAILRAAGDEDIDLVERRWSWPGPRGWKLGTPSGNRSCRPSSRASPAIASGAFSIR